jgi:hypothetical protein
MDNDRRQIADAGRSPAPRRLALPRPRQEDAADVAEDREDLEAGEDAVASRS